MPVPAGSSNSEYTAVFTGVLIPALQDFSPEFSLISVDFDARYLDPLAGTELTADVFFTLTDPMLEFAKEAISGRAVSALEGGYSLEEVSESIVTHVECSIKEYRQD